MSKSPKVQIGSTVARLKSEQCERVNRAAFAVKADIGRQIQQNFNTTDGRFTSGVRVQLNPHDGDTCSAQVSLSPVLATHAEPTTLRGNPYLWVLLPAGKRLGLQRISKGNTRSALKAKYGSDLRSQPSRDGFIVLLRTQRGLEPIYSVKRKIQTKQRIDFEEAARKGAEELNG